MKTYQTIKDYLIDAKKGDSLVFGDVDILDKNNTFEFVREIDGEMKIKKYGGNFHYTIVERYYNQKVSVLTNEEFYKLINS